MVQYLLLKSDGESDDPDLGLTSDSTSNGGVLGGDNYSASHTTFADSPEFVGWESSNAVPDQYLETGNLYHPYKDAKRGIISYDSDNSYTPEGGSVRHEATENDSFTNEGLYSDGDSWLIKDANPGETFRATAWVKSASGGASVQIYCLGGSSSTTPDTYTSSTITASDTEWRKVFTEHTLGSDENWVTLRLDNDGGDGAVVYWDNIRLEKVNRENTSSSPIGNTQAASLADQLSGGTTSSSPAANVGTTSSSVLVGDGTSTTFSNALRDAFSASTFGNSSSDTTADGLTELFTHADQPADIDTSSVTEAFTESFDTIDRTGLGDALSTVTADTTVATTDGSSSLAEAVSEPLVAATAASAVSQSADGSFTDAYVSAVENSSSLGPTVAGSQTAVTALGTIDGAQFDGLTGDASVEIIAFVSPEEAATTANVPGVDTSTGAVALTENAVAVPVSPTLDLVIAPAKGEVSLEAGFADSLAADVGAATSIKVAKTKASGTSQQSELNTSTTTEPATGLDFEPSRNTYGVAENIDYGSSTSELTIAHTVNAEQSQSSYFNTFSIYGSDNVAYAGFKNSSNGNEFRFVVNDGSFQSISFTVPKNERASVIGVYDGSEIKAYVNGELKSSSSVGSSINLYSKIKIGGNTEDSGQFYDGVLYDAQVYNRALSEKEIDRVSDGNSVTDGLIGSWDFSTDFGDTAFDSVGTNDISLKNSPDWITGQKAVSTVTLQDSGFSTSTIIGAATLATYTTLGNSSSATSVTGDNADGSFATLTDVGSSATDVSAAVRNAVASELDASANTLVTAEALSEAAEALIEDGVVDTQVEAAALVSDVLASDQRTADEAFADVSGDTETFETIDRAGRPTSFSLSQGARAVFDVSTEDVNPLAAALPVLSATLVSAIEVRAEGTSSATPVVQPTDLDTEVINGLLRILYPSLMGDNNAVVQNERNYADLEH